MLTDIIRAARAQQHRLFKTVEKEANILFIDTVETGNTERSIFGRRELQKLR